MSESGFPNLHFEIREGGLYQKHTVNPFEYLPYDDTIDHTVAISEVYIHTPGPGDPTVTARAIVTAPRDELDFNRITMMVDSGSGTDQRTIDFQALNKEMTTLENPEILDNPCINDVCIMPARFNRYADEYRVDFVFYGLQGSDSVALTAEAADVHSNLVHTSKSQSAREIIISPNQHVSSTWPGTTIAYTHILSNEDDTPHTLNLSATSAQSWATYISPSITLPPGQKQITVSITVPAGASGRTDCTVVMATDEADGTLQVIAVDVTDVPYLSFLPVILKDHFP
jgi:hypothetical protein